MFNLLSKTILGLHILHSCKLRSGNPIIHNLILLVKKSTVFHLRIS
jgi:hypothetical protein